MGSIVEDVELKKRVSEYGRKKMAIQLNMRPMTLNGKLAGWAAFTVAEREKIDTILADSKK